MGRISWIVSSLCCHASLILSTGGTYQSLQKTNLYLLLPLDSLSRLQLVLTEYTACSECSISGGLAQAC